MPEQRNETALPLCNECGNERGWFGPCPTCGADEIDQADMESSLYRLGLSHDGQFETHLGGSPSSKEESCISAAPTTAARGSEDIPGTRTIASADASSTATEAGGTSTTRTARSARGTGRSSAASTTNASDSRNGTALKLTEERLRWIESWAKGWRNALTARYGDKDYYAELTLDVAVSMIEELVAALRDPDQALALLADKLMESGAEIGELVEARRG